MSSDHVAKAGESARPVRIPSRDIELSGLWLQPEDAQALLVLAHGAGAGMEHPHLDRLARRLAEEQVATLRYQFPYMERGTRRPDRAPVLEQAVRDAVSFARAEVERTGGEEAGGLPIFAGGRSMGARMTARAHVAAALPVRGLVFFAFPLHRPLRVADPDPETLERAAHLFEVDVPMLFLAGSRDRLARPHLLEGVTSRIETPGLLLHMVDTADHSFVPTRKSGRDLEDVEQEIASVCARWMVQSLGGAAPVPT